MALQRHIPSIFCLAQLFKNLNYEQSIKQALTYSGAAIWFTYSVSLSSVDFTREVYVREPSFSEVCKIFSFIYYKKIML